MQESGSKCEPREDKVGLGWCVHGTHKDGRAEIVTGFGSREQAEERIEKDSLPWTGRQPQPEADNKAEGLTPAELNAAKDT